MSGKLIGAVIALVIVVVVAITSLRFGYFAFQAEAPQDSNQAIDERQRREAEQQQADLEKKRDEERKLAGISKTMSASEIVDYRFLREALSGLKGRR